MEEGKGDGEGVGLGNNGTWRRGGNRFKQVGCEEGARVGVRSWVWEGALRSQGRLAV